MEDSRVFLSSFYWILSMYDRRIEFKLIDKLCLLKIYPMENLKIAYPELVWPGELVKITTCPFTAKKTQIIFSQIDLNKKTPNHCRYNFLENHVDFLTCLILNLIQVFEQKRFNRSSLKRFGRQHRDPEEVKILTLKGFNRRCL